MKKKLIIYGTGNFAEYIRYAFECDSEYEVIAYCVEELYLSKLTSQAQNGLNILNFNELIKTHPPTTNQLFIAVGNDAIRERIYNEAVSLGYNFANYISSKATTWDNLKIGKNVFISEDTAIQPFVEIGNNTILIGPRIGHHTKIGDHVLLSLSFIGANSVIGDNSFLGLNSAIKPNTVIGKRNIIGIGSNITRSTQDNEVYTSQAANKRSLDYFDLGTKYL